MVISTVPNTVQFPSGVWYIWSGRWEGVKISGWAEQTRGYGTHVPDLLDVTEYEVVLRYRG